ncbi:peptidyl-Lys metalloendopeptidase [Coprinopsis sp. MPI-PUGE-AT-0042]|nr:peptidyl-Lys metalloendopeptidase [Coprinopsis sp. MPI-PUGE-AT-0042]
MPTFRASFIVLLACTLSASAAFRLALEVTGPALVRGVDNFNVVTILTNKGDETVKVLNHPDSPLSRLPADTFIIRGENGATPAFIGIKAKYGPQAAIDAREFTVLAPNQSIHVRHSLADGYDFSSAGQGAYTINARNGFYIATGNTTAKVNATVVSSHNAKLSGSIARPLPVTEKQATGSACSPAQEAQIQKAAASAQDYAAAAFSHLQAHPSATPRYTTWFGSYDEDNHELVQAHFKTINSHNISTFSFDCSCRVSGTFAYVYPHDFGKIYLCGAFWRAPLQGSDSKAGTLVHESSHFTRNGGTQDYVYGQSASRDLAMDDPSMAVLNADSHEYFAENTPLLD